MTLDGDRDRAALHGNRVSCCRAAVLDELYNLLDALDKEATHREKMYADLGLNGEDRARELRDLAASLYKRITLYEQQEGVE